MSKLRITLFNRNFYNDCEEALVNYFKTKRKPDLRFLKYIRYFFDNSYCAVQRYDEFKILLKYNLLDNNDLENLCYDSNEDTSKLARKIIKKAKIDT